MSNDQYELVSQEERLVVPPFVRNKLATYFDSPRRAQWPTGEHILVGRRPGADDVRLQSNDYLALAHHPEVRAAAHAAIDADADDGIMAAVFQHGECAQARFEAAMARLMGAEATVLTQSGWAANTGLLQCLLTRDVPVYIDMFAHMSLHEGIRLGGGVPHMFRHNSMRSLERLVRRFGPGYIVVDSVYSTTGDVAPLHELVAFAERAGCWLIVDEAHALGTHGPGGGGLVAELGLARRVPIRTASLAKGFASRAGIIACSAEIAEFVKYQANPAIFSSAVLPFEIARLDAVRRVIEGADDRRARLAALSARLRDGLRALGYSIENSSTHVVSLHPGEEWRLIALRNALEARGVFGSVFCAPATPLNGSLLRFTLHCDLDEAQIDRVLRACAEVRDEVQLDAWESTRRAAFRAAREAECNDDPAAAAAEGR